MTATIPELLEAAAAAWRAGQLGQAEQAYRQVLEQNPGHAEALGQLGLLAFRAGRPELAVEYLRRSAEASPKDAGRRLNLGAALASQGRAGEAEAAFRAALRLWPDFPEAHVNLGNVLNAQGRHAEAETECREALRLRPDYPEAHNNLGNILNAQGRRAEAETEYRTALRLRPGYAEAHVNLGNVLCGQGRLAEAETECREALRLRPDFAGAHNGLGCALFARGGLAEAEAEYRAALRLRPNYAEAHNNLGGALREQGKLAEAEAEYRTALRLRPDYADAHHGLGTLLLSQERYREGWSEYEWRWRANGLIPRVFLQPAWDGTPVSGTLLLCAEQGLGDTLQFVRYAALAKQRAGTVVLECPPALIPLLSRCPGIERLVGQGSPLPAFDAHATLASLPHLLGTTDTLSAAVPYLTADPDLVRRWRDELAGLGSFTIGIAWQGNPNFSQDRQRSVPLAAFEPLARLPGVRLVVLQKVHGREQLAATAGWPLTDLGERLDESGAFLDTAAVMRAVDLLVLSDSAPAHLAGALGVPCWVALPFAADWRWLVGRADSPWYPTARLYRQTRPGDWATVFERMAADLRQRVGPT